jgi:hypothetical protein
VVGVWPQGTTKKITPLNKGHFPTKKKTEVTTKIFTTAF